LERGETNGKKQSLLAKICDGPMFHLGTTGNYDVELQEARERWNKTSAK
jgi:hypothetical protein